MESDIIVALIMGLASIATVIISSRKNASDVDAKLDKQQAIMETKIDMLASEVREHNSFARRMPVVEEQIKVINNRIDDLCTKNVRLEGKVFK